MNKSRIYFILIILVISGCYEDPEFSETPYIEFRSISYTDLEGRPDSLILSFYFEDGLGDIGLSSNETFSPYHPFNLVVDSQDSVVTLSDTMVVPPLYLIDPFISDPDFNNKILFSQTDDRPPYDCNFYQRGLLNGSTKIDTFYIQENLFNNNIHVEFLRKRNNEYTTIDFASEFGNDNCSVVDFDGRIPIFEPEAMGEPLSGTISYSMQSLGFRQIFRSDPIKIRFYVFDRALNKSNVVETPDFVLADITK